MTSKTTPQRPATSFTKAAGATQAEATHTEDAKRAPVSEPSAAALSDALKKLLSIVCTAQRLLQDRQAVNLAGLDRRIAEVCDGISALPPDQARAFVTPMKNLVQALDDLATANQRALEARSWLLRDPDGITPMRRRTDAPPAAVVTSAYAASHRSVSPRPESQPPESQLPESQPPTSPPVEPATTGPAATAVSPDQGPLGVQDRRKARTSQDDPPLET